MNPKTLATKNLNPSPAGVSPLSPEAVLQIDRREWLWAAGWALIIVFFSCIPYLIVWTTVPEGWTFFGLLANPLDNHTYLAKMRQGWEGDWLLHLTHTPEPHQGVFLYTFYLSLGHFAAAMDLPLIVVFHLIRIIASLGLLLIAYYFIALISPLSAIRKLGFIFVGTASGLGWLGIMMGALPIDLWIPEAFTPNSIYTNPHFPTVMALMLIIFCLALKLTVSIVKSITLLKLSFFAGVTALVLTIVQPFGLITVIFVLVIFTGGLFWSRKSAWIRLAWFTFSIILFSMPILIYDYWLSVTHPVIKGWSAQNITPAPAFSDLLWGYGWLGVLALGSAWHMIRQKWPASTAEGFLVIWMMVTVMLIYAPFSFQRRLITGLHIPVCILAAVGLNRWLADRTKKFRRIVLIVFVSMGVSATLFAWELALVPALQPPDFLATNGLLFLRDDEQQAFDWLRQHASRDDIVLASPRLGLFLPGQTGVRVFYGHHLETVEADFKLIQVEAFYRGEVDSVTPAVDYIIDGPSEHLLGERDDFDGAKAVFSVGEVTIYEAGGRQISE